MTPAVEEASVEEVAEEEAPAIEETAPVEEVIPVEEAVFRFRNSGQVRNSGKRWSLEAVETEVGRELLSAWKRVFSLSYHLLRCYERLFHIICLEEKQMKGHEMLFLDVSLFWILQ